MSNRDKREPPKHCGPRHYQQGTPGEFCKWDGNAVVSGEVSVKPPKDLLAGYQASQQETASQNKHQKLINWLTFGAVFIYAGLTLWLAITSQTSVSEAKKANQESRDRFRQDERPYLTFALIEAEKATLVVQDSGPHASQAAFKFTIQNFGKTPAIVTGEDVHIALGEEEIRRISYRPATERLRMIVPPGDRPPITAYSDPISARRIVDGKAIFHAEMPRAVYGHIDYVDMFSDSPTYTLSFCHFMSDPQTPGVQYPVSAELQDLCRNQNDIK